MKKPIKICYMIFFLAAICLSIFVFFSESNLETGNRENAGYTVVDRYYLDETTDDSGKVIYDYHWKLKDVPDMGALITFYSVHCKVQFYVDDELVGRLDVNPNNRFGNTTACDWAKGYIYPADEGKEIHIYVEPVYERSMNTGIKIYYGDAYEIAAHIVLENMPVVIIGFLLILIGIGFITFGIVTIRNTEADRSVIYLGVFAITAGLWKWNDMQLASILMHHPLAENMISILSLPIMTMQYLMYIQSQFKKKYTVIWNILGGIGDLAGISIIVLQLFNVLDVRQTIVFTHTWIILCIIGVIIMLFLESNYMKWGKKLLVTVICSSICLAGALIDLGIYYAAGYSGTVILCVSGFLIYVLCMGYMSVKETKELMERGRDAKHYEQMAMHDSLTGLFSRAFYNEYLRSHDLKKSDCAILMFDMNHLKKSNDTYGHDFGDARLKAFGVMLGEIFSSVGKVCRFGGDEFCVIIRRKNQSEWMPLFDEYAKRVDEYNQKEKADIPLSAAYGYAFFDEEEDDDFSNTIRRADKMMYQMKVFMKMERKED